MLRAFPSVVREHGLAGRRRGLVRPGFTYGASDDLAMDVAREPVHAHDFQATVLHLPGIDHERPTHRFQGRQFRLTDVHGRVAREPLA